MITGHVNAKREAVILLTVCGAQEVTRQIEAIIDTGYSAYLTLPTEMVAALGLISIGNQQLILADGSEVDSALYPATVIWDGQPRPIEIDAVEGEALVGMALLEGYELNVRVVVGGSVTLNPFSPASPAE